MINNLMLTTNGSELARKFALSAHGDQKYGDEFPYIVHLVLCHMIGVQAGVRNQNVLNALLLHDTLEDTDTDYETLEAIFGTRVADIVAAVTEPKGMNRKQRHADTYPRIAKDPDARVVKLCDRISHVWFGGKKVGMYFKEHADFKKALWIPSMSEIETVLWKSLDHMISQISRQERENYANSEKFR